MTVEATALDRTWTFNPSRVVRIAALVAVTMGCLAILGWATGSAFLTGDFLGIRAIRANAAIALVFAGASLWLLGLPAAEPHHQRRLLLGWACATVVVVISSLTLIEHLADVNLGIDQAIFTDRSNHPGQGQPGRMSLPTALSLLLLGVAFLVLDRRPKIAESLAVGTNIIGLYSITAFAYGRPSFGLDARYATSAVHIALTLVLLGTAALFSRPRRGLVAILMNPATGGIAARRLLPPVLILPLVIGGVLELGKRANFYAAFESGTAFATLEILITSGLVLLLARILNRLDRERTMATARLATSEEQLRALSDASPVGIIHIDVGGSCRYTNHRWQDIAGLTLDQSLDDGWLQAVHPNDRTIALNHWSEMTRDDADHTQELRFVTSEGDVRWVLLRTAVLGNAASSQVAGYVSTVEDITARLRAEQETRLLQSITTEIGQADDLHSALLVALENVCQATGWVFGEAWMPEAEGTDLRAVAIWHDGHPDLAHYAVSTSDLRLVPGEGLTGAAWASQRWAWRSDITRDPMFRLVAGPRDAGLRSALAIPIVANERVVAVLALFDREVRAEDTRLAELLSSVASHLGAFVLKKQAEDALRISEERNRAILNAMPDMMFVLDRQGTYLDYKAHRAHELPAPPDDILGRRLRDLMPPETAASVEQAIDRALSTGDVQTVEYQLAIEDEPLAFDARIAPNGPDTVVSVVRDVTERNRAEIELAQERDLLQTLIDNLNDLIFFKDIAGRYVQVNRPAARHLGAATPADAIGKTDFDFYQAAEAQGFADDDQRIVTTGQPLVNKIERHSADSEPDRWTLTSKFPLRDTSGQIVGLVGSSHDVTAQRQMEAQLQLAEAKYRELVERLPAVVYSQRNDATASAIYFSPRIKDLVGYSADEWLADPDLWVTLLHPDDRDRVLKEHHRTNQSGDAFRMEYRLVAQDGQAVWVRDEAVLLYDEAGNPLH